MAKEPTDGYCKGSTIYSTVKEMKGTIKELVDFGEGVIVVSVQWENGQISDFLLNPKTDLLVEDGCINHGSRQLLN
jgi:hypothetical protein